MPVIGTKEQVWSGDALRTKGGLTKDALIMNARGKVVSAAKSQQAAARYNQMKKDGYTLHPSTRAGATLSGSMIETGNLVGGATLSGSMIETGNLVGGKRAASSKAGLFTFSS